jgi:hypothetical protein
MTCIQTPMASVNNLSVMNKVQRILMYFVISLTLIVYGNKG